MIQANKRLPTYSIRESVGFNPVTSWLLKSNSIRFKTSYLQTDNFYIA